MHNINCLKKHLLNLVLNSCLTLYVNNERKKKLCELPFNLVKNGNINKYYTM